MEMMAGLVVEVVGERVLEVSGMTVAVVELDEETVITVVVE